MIHLTYWKYPYAHCKTLLRFHLDVRSAFIHRSRIGRYSVAVQFTICRKFGCGYINQIFVESNNSPNWSSGQDISFSLKYRDGRGSTPRFGEFFISSFDIMFEQLRFCISNVSRYSMFGFGRDRSENVKILCGGRSGDF